MNTEDQKELKESQSPLVESTGEHSEIFGVSLRGWIALVVVLTVCVMSALKIDVMEPLYTLAGLIVGFYFGQAPRKNQG